MYHEEQDLSLRALGDGITASFGDGHKSAAEAAEEAALRPLRWLTGDGRRVTGTGNGGGGDDVI